VRAKVTLSQPLHVQDKIATCAPSLISTSLSTGHQNGYFPYLGGNVLFVCPWSGLHEIYKSVLVHVALTSGSPASPREAGLLFFERLTLAAPTGMRFTCKTPRFYLRGRHCSRRAPPPPLCI